MKNKILSFILFSFLGLSSLKAVLNEPLFNSKQEEKKFISITGS